jgi:hypothetical protein
VNKWYDLALPAIRVFFPILTDKGDTERRRPEPSTTEQMDTFYADYLRSMHLCPPA